MTFKILLPILLLASISTPTYAKWSYGIGYIDQEDFRVDNEVNSLPFGISAVPLISYNGPKLSINGPQIRYRLLNGMFGATLHLAAVGNRYESEEVNLRETGYNGGVSLRALYLTVKHTTDLFRTYNGNITSIVLAHRFMPFDNLMFIPRVGYEYTNRGYNNYYYGVRESEVGTYQAYDVSDARNKIAGATTVYIMNQSSSLTINYSHTQLDQVIFDSPTVNLRSYKTWGVFLSFAMN